MQHLEKRLKRHLNFPNTVQAIRLVKKLYPEARYILIEDKANGSAIIQTLRHEFVGIISITPKGGKVSRVNSVSPAIESGNVWLPKDDLFAEEMVDEFTRFPNGEHDDTVDACSQALNYMLFATGATGIPESPERRWLEDALTAEREMIVSGAIYDVYGGNELY